MEIIDLARNIFNAKGASTAAMIAVGSALAGCSAGPASMADRAPQTNITGPIESPYRHGGVAMHGERTTAGNWVIIRRIEGTRTVRWGFNNMGYMAPGAYVTQGSMEGCWHTQDVVVQDRVNGTEFETKVVTGQVIGVGPENCGGYTGSTLNAGTDFFNGIRRGIRRATPQQYGTPYGRRYRY